MTYPRTEEIESQSDKTGHKEMELAAEGAQEGFCCGGYYLFLLLSKTLRSVVTIEMFYLTRCSCGSGINGRACEMFPCVL